MCPNSRYALRNSSSPSATFSREKISPSFIGKSERKALTFVTSLLPLNVIPPKRVHTVRLRR